MKTGRKLCSVLLAVLMIVTAAAPGLTAFAASPTITITDEDGAEITETVEVQEYRSVQLSYTTSDDAPEGSYVVWESNLPLLADVDDTGKVTAYDYSKAAIIQLWLDEEVRSTPLIGDTMADAIEKAIEDSGYDLDTVNTDVLVALVRSVAGDTLADSLQTYLDNMNVEVTATLYDADGNALASDTVDVLVTQSLIASVAPTGVHITNKKSVPTTVAVGATVQLYGAVTPVRLEQDVKWSMGSNAFDTSSSSYANVSSDGLVTFTAAGTATVRVNPESTIYAAFSDTITFTIVEQSELPVTDFTITGTTTVNEGATTQLAIDELTPAGAYTGDLVWSSSDTSVAVVDQNGIVTGLDGGSGYFEYSKTVTITATIGSVSKSVDVTVKRSITSSTISGVEISGESAIANDATAQYTSTVYPSRYNTSSSVSREWGLVDDSGEYIWALDGTPAETDLASMDSSGVLTPKSSGVITIAARATYNGTSVTNTMQVVSGTAITDFTITGTSTVTENSTVQLSITDITPSDYDEALLDTVKWSSADPKIASVDDAGLVRGLDAGGMGSTKSQSTTIYATIGGLTKSFTITVKGAWINYVTSAEISGPDYVIKDFPITYTASFTPSRLDISRTLWGLPTDEGTAPWTASNTLSSSGNMANSIATVDDNGLVTGLSTGQTTLHLYGARNITSYNETQKDITVVELEPKSITITAPTKTDYVEGETELDLTGLKVELTYDREDIEQYYGDTSSLYTDDQLKVEVTDYTVSEINQSELDKDQYIVVSVTRAGKVFRGVFAINLASKALTSIDITDPQYKYLEGTTSLDLSGLTVTANYSNADPETVTDYTVDASAFDPELYNVEQTIPVTYSHAGRTASASFKVIVYGIPVVSVDTGEYSGGWSSGDVTFTLESTNKLDGDTVYYYKTDDDTEWTALSGNTYTVSENSEKTYYFKAINSEGIEGESTEGYTVKRDDVTPSFTLTPDVTDITNQSYSVKISDISTGSSGLASITLNGEDITGSTEFTADENGEYIVVVTAGNGLSLEKTINIENIDKTAPAVNSITLLQKNDGSIARIINTLTFGLFFNETIEITIDASDEGVAGIEKIEYRFLDENGLPTGSDWQTYDENAKPEQDPNYTGYVEARAVDKAGNVSECLRSDGYVIDGDAPSTPEINAAYGEEEYVSGTWVADGVEITVSSDAYSGIFEYRYRVDGGEWQTMEGGSVTASQEGEHLYEFKAISNSALDSEISSVTVKIDRQVPVIRVDFAGTFGRWTSDEVTFGFSTLESSLSGITYYYNDGTSDEWTKITTGSSLSLSEDTNGTYSFKAVNGAGTESTPSDSYVVMIDSQTPSVTATQTVTDSTCVPYEVTVNTSAGAAGIKTVTMNGEDITGESSVTVSKNGSYLFMVTAGNGKTAAYVLTVDNFYTPVIEVTGIEFGAYARKTDGEFGTIYNENTEITITAQNTGVTGIEKIEYRLLDESKNPVGDWLVYDESSKSVLEGGFKGYVEAVAYDSEGNCSQSVVSQAALVDTTAPEAPEVSARVNGADYSGEWTDGEVEIQLTSSAFSGIYEYYYRIDGGEWQSAANGKVVCSENGTHTYEFKAVSNALLESEASSLTVNRDAEKPALSVGVNGTIGSKTSEAVTFTLSASPQSGVTYYYNDGSGWQQLSGDTLTIDETITADYTFKAVNGAGVESEISPCYSVIIDKDYEVVERTPVLSVSVNGTVGSYTSQNVTFSFTCAEAKDGVTYYYDDGSGFKAITGNVLEINSDTDKTYTFKAIDGSGKESLVSPEYEVMIDKTIPSVTLSPSAQTNANDAVTVTVSAAAGKSGVKSITVNGGDITGESSFEVTENGTYGVTVTAGNGLYAYDEITFTSFDYDAPEIDDISFVTESVRQVNGISYFNSETEISISASDNGVSGIKTIEYRLLDENGETLSDWTVYDSENKLTVSPQFKGCVEARATDNAGNVSETVKSDVFVTDGEAPSDVVISATDKNGDEYDGEYTNGGVTITLSSSAYSDIYEYLYSIDGGEWAALSGSSLSAVDGEHTYEFKAVSYSGNESAVSSITTKVENGVPALTVSVSGTTGEWTTQPVIFSLSATGGSSGIIYYYNDGSGWQQMSGNMLTVSEAGDKTYAFKAVSGTGAESEVSESYRVMLDSITSATLSSSVSSGSSVSDDVMITYSADAASGISKYQYSLNGSNWTDFDGTVSTSGDGSYSYKFRAVSNSGAISDETEYSVRISSGIPMYRLYNPNSGEHFYTANTYERDNLISLGWTDEGIGWYAPKSSSTPVYRLYNENGGEHHYTTDENEKNILVSLGWTDEGIGWYSDDNKGVALYRQYNPNAYANNHNYTTNKSENDWLVSLGWQAEGIGWYGVA